MLVSYKWPNRYIDLSNVTPEELADEISVTGIEVEGVTVPEGDLRKIVVNEIKECIPHPDSGHPSICRINIDEDELSQIVCGAPDVKVGIKVIVALPNSRITDNVKIKKGKIHGRVSDGMICSLQETGYSGSVIPEEYAEGIYYIPQEAVSGDPVSPYLGMDNSTIELSIAPNRADALSVRSATYEVGAIYRQTPTFDDEKLVESSRPASDKIQVKIESKEAVPAYQIRIIEGVRVQPSPQRLQNLLMNEGIRPASDVVDVTNYILFLFERPLHTFDYDKLKSEKIFVRRARESETLVTLDGESRELTTNNLIITNSKEPVALTGVMGRLDSEITSETTTVALEFALFGPISIHRTAEQFSLRSESSTRFEEGINHATVGEASEVAVTMIVSLTGGEVLRGTVRGSEIKAEDVSVKISLEHINQYSGTFLVVREVNEIFETPGFNYEEKEYVYSVVTPPRRWGIQIEANIIEEAACIYGYDQLPSTLPSGETVTGSLSKEQETTRKIRIIFGGSGLSEAISYTLTTEEKSGQFVINESNITHLG